MIKKYRFKIDKLVRDNVPVIMRTQGIEVFERILQEEEFLRELKNKLLEETKEIISAKTPDEHLEELADLLEVLYTLGNSLGLSMQAIEEKRLAKKQEKGGFDKHAYNAFIEIDSDNERIGYFRARPEDYPELEE